MLDNNVADFGSASRQQRKTEGRESRLQQYFSELWAMVGVSLEGLRTTVLPVTSAAMVIPARIASGKFQGGIITTDTERQVRHLILLSR